MIKRTVQIVLVFTSAVVLLRQQVYCAPCYGTYLPKPQGFLCGFQTHALIDRNLEDTFGSVRSLQQFFQISYGATRWFSIDCKVGAGRIKQHPVGSDEIDYPTSFAGGYGFRVLLFDDEDLGVRVVFGFQHISVHPRSARINRLRNATVLDDWQASLLVSKKILNITPYAGVKLSRVDYIHWIEENRKRRMSDLTKSYGAVLGVDIPFFFDSLLNLEGHFLDEDAASVAVMFEF